MAARKIAHNNLASSVVSAGEIDNALPWKLVQFRGVSLATLAD